MIRRISALIWLRTQMILSNGAMLFQIIFPYALLFLYDRFLNPDHDPSKSLQILFIMLPLAFSLSMGTMITIMLAEEKEKKIKFPEVKIKKRKEPKEAGEQKKSGDQKERQ